MSVRFRHAEGWPNRRSDGRGCRMDIRSRAFERQRACAVYSVTHRFGSCGWTGAQKTICSCCGRVQKGWYDRRLRHVRDLSSAGFRIVLELEVRRVACRRCGTVKRERLDFLADNVHFTKRFAFYVGGRCRQASIRDVAKELKLDWDTVKTLEMQYLRAELKRAGTPGPRAIGGADRSEASMAAFYDWLGPKKSRKIRLAVMDVWKPFCNVTKDKAAQAAILFDKF